MIDEKDPRYKLILKNEGYTREKLIKTAWECINSELSAQSLSKTQKARTLPIDIEPVKR